MDETLIHCVDDIETDDPDVILEIDFPDEDTVYVRIFKTYPKGWHKYSALRDGVLGGGQQTFSGGRVYSFAPDLRRCDT